MILFPNNALGSPPEMIEQVALGTLDMSLNTQGQLENHVKASATPQIPFIFDDYDHAHRTLDGPAMQWFIPQFEKAGPRLPRQLGVGGDWGFPEPDQQPAARQQARGCQGAQESGCPRNSTSSLSSSRWARW